MAKEVEAIWQIIEDGENFLLSGGAGSGKTYSLIEIIKKIYLANSKSNVACITYTNSAVATIKKRAPFDNLKVLTIHNFLWEEIKRYQKELKEELVILCAEKDKEIEIDEIPNVQYREWRSYKKGVISHDEVLVIAERMFAKHKLLCDIVKDKYDFVLVDEYQDTYPSTVEVLLNHISKSSKKMIVGFFGDSMQNIYDGRVGNLEEYIASDKVKEVKKEDNFRCPEKVIALINQIRDDGLIQRPSEIESAKNFGVQGAVTFLYSNKDEISPEEIKAHTAFETFTFDKPNETKELYLIHGLIANQAGFGTLYDTYNNEKIIEYAGRLFKYLGNNNIDIDEDRTFRSYYEEYGGVHKLSKPTKTQLEYIVKFSEDFELALDYPLVTIKSTYISSDDLIGSSRSKKANDQNASNKRDALCQHLENIEECIESYEGKDYNLFIKKTNFVIKTIADKQKLKNAITELADMVDSSIEEVIEKAHELEILLKTEKLQKFIDDNSYIYSRVKKIKYQEWKAVFRYIEQFTIYSTQHSIKGEEFENVFVMLDNGKWNNFNFKYLFGEDGNNETVLRRTRNLFYVCCSRTMKNLVVYFHKPSETVLTKAKELFGDTRVIQI